jgi:hypothetical protein
MLPKIHPTPLSPSSKKLLLANPIFDIKQETILLALSVLNLNIKSYNALDYDDLKHYKVTNEISGQALAILLYYKGLN